MEDIHEYLMENDDWMKSSIRTANALYADVRYRNTGFHWYHGNKFVKAINDHWKVVNNNEGILLILISGVQQIYGYVTALYHHL